MLSLQDTPQEFTSGQEIANLVTLCCPEQTRQQTAAQELIIHKTEANLFAAEVDGFLCAGNLGAEATRLPVAATTRGSDLYLGRWESTIVKLGQMEVFKDLEN